MVLKEQSVLNKSNIAAKNSQFRGFSVCLLSFLAKIRFPKVLVVIYSPNFVDRVQIKNSIHDRVR